MTQIVKKALDFLRPHRPHHLFPLCFVSETTRTNAKKIFDYLMQEGELATSDLEEIKRLVEESPRNDVRNIFNVVNWDGFTLLQRAVINNHMTVVKLLIKKGCDTNAGICSLPLPLACRLGHVNITQLLLTHGARADLECTVCYPEEHKLKTCPDQIYCLAYQPVYTPILYALCGDNHQILPLLINHENSRQLVKTDFLLHEACKMGAHACSRYLLQHYSEQMSQENTDGKTPLQISLVMDAESAMFLLSNGAELNDSVFLTENGSTLHELIKRKSNLGLLKATKFALEHGFRSHINVRDQEGNTALYVLLRHVGRTVRSNIQSEYDHEVQESVKLLLYHGSNPNIPNQLGENSLHVVLSDSIHRPLYVSRHGQVRRLKPILQEIYKVIEILLAHGADLTQRSSSIVSPLYYAIRIFQSLQPDMFVVVKTALKHLFILLCQENCNVNAVDSCGVPVFVHLLTSSYHWIQNNTANVAFCKAILPFLAYMLQHFLKRNLDPVAHLTFWTSRMEEVIESNYFKEIFMYVNLDVVDDPHFYDNARQLAIKLVQRGGNPNLMTYLSKYSIVVVPNGITPRDVSIAFILTKALYSSQKEYVLVAVIDVINFFYKTLSQIKLKELSDAIQHCSNTEFKSNVPGLAVQSILHKVACTPRTLRELCRLAIADSLEWKLARKGPSLPLPKALLHYLTNFDL